MEDESNLGDGGNVSLTFINLSVPKCLLILQSLMHAKKLVRDCDREQLHRANKEECRILLERFSSEDFFNALITFNQKKSKL